jgi:hypothetical protein
MTREKRHNPNLDSTFRSEADQGSKKQDISLWSDRKYILTLSVVLLISFIVYLPSLGSGFVDWDDGGIIYKNPNIINVVNWGTFFRSAKEIFTSYDANGNYNPLALISFALEHMLYGLDSPGWWHLNNVPYSFSTGPKINSCGFLRSLIWNPSNEGRISCMDHRTQRCIVRGILPACSLLLY